MNWHTVRSASQLLGEGVTLGSSVSHERAVPVMQLCNDVGEGEIVVPTAVVEILHVLASPTVVGMEERIGVAVEVDRRYTEIARRARR